MRPAVMMLAAALGAAGTGTAHAQWAAQWDYRDQRPAWQVPQDRQDWQLRQLEQRRALDDGYRDRLRFEQEELARQRYEDRHLPPPAFRNYPQAYTRPW